VENREALDWGLISDLVPAAVEQARTIEGV
jgi:hypothetical protein